MDYNKYDECQMRLGAISDDFYLDALAIIKSLDSKDRAVAEQIVERLKCSLDEICIIVSYSLRG